MGDLSAKDREAYLFLRGRGLLKDVDAHRIDMRKGVVCVACSCGDYFDDAYANIAMTCLEHRPNPRICPFLQRGGALVIPSDSLLNQRYRSDNLVQDIFQSLEEERINVVALYAHAPCTVAAKAEYDLVETIDQLVRAKVGLKTESLKYGGKIKIACFVHVDRGQDEGPRTYFVSADEWQLVYRKEQVRLPDALQSRK